MSKDFLNTSQLNSRKEFIKSYMNSSNTASASEVDSNSNVSGHGIPQMRGEIYKKFDDPFLR